MSREPSQEALRQLCLRHRLAANAADAYAEAGFTAVLQDTVLGELLQYTIDQIETRPLYVVVLAPRPYAVAAREAARGKEAYGTFSVADLDSALRQTTPRIGLWLDTSDLTVEQTVDQILTRAEPLPQ